VLSKAYSLRIARGDHHITVEHLADAIELLLATRHRMPVSEEAIVPKIGAAVEAFDGDAS
jgi:hypothetical protein